MTQLGSTAPVRLISDLEAAAIGSMVEGGSADLEKRGLQYLCELLQSGALLVHRRAMLSKLANLRWSPDVKVRSWLYNTLARLRAREFRDYLTHQIIFSETDEENLTWAVAAFFAMSYPEEVDALIRQKSLVFWSTASELAAQLYYDGSYGCRIDPETLAERIEKEPLLAQWYVLLYGYGRAATRLPEMRHAHIDYVSAFNGHDNDDIAEYSIWSLHKSPEASISAATLNPDAVLNRSPRIRRWYYRLLLKSDEGLFQNLDFVRSAIKEERDNLAREGLAIGLASQYRSELAPVLLEWFLSEQDELIRLALAPQFATFAQRSSAYTDLLRSRLALPRGDLSNEILRARAAGNPNLPQYLLNESKVGESIGCVTIQVGAAGAMGGDNKNVTNIAVGGNISIGSLNLGELQNSTIEAVASLDAAGAGAKELQALLKPYLELIESEGASIPANDRAVLLESVKDLARAEKQPEPARKAFVNKALACMKGVASGMSQAAVLAAATDKLVHSVAPLLGL